MCDCSQCCQHAVCVLAHCVWAIAVDDMLTWLARRRSCLLIVKSAVGYEVAVEKDGRSRVLWGMGLRQADVWCQYHTLPGRDQKRLCGFEASCTAACAIQTVYAV